MNHALKNWRTSAAGILLGIASIAGVLSGQGVTLGHAGTGTVVTLIAGVCMALVGLLARDPGSAPNPTQPETPPAQQPQPAQIAKN